ncbi:S-adenosyl-L-methionine-dependent methyltransferase [Aspergillus heteromorphus CBS 117.55]|uniref:S-adenosyl-L-methionine-dependent methyltransferase n=1 Tax=Aspergillus heteromorphus CBS 117.55 TaxID=1448321 RepID=A0A317WPC4_9EURO|nr:S-adenosyl-L-methionine-dependent methyltransferase [Aspergillus heteromorphus CBS 117.55]PWY86728.1 S-adenosyl-L-methionine-dependent methyltransferase [Aspergillus heteromorphus CBS 117.55]
MEALAAHVRSLAQSGDEKQRKDIIDSLRSLRNSIETSDDTVQRFTFYNMQLAGLRIGINLKLFELLAESKTPLTVTQLSEKTGADAVFLARLLRYLASFEAIKETDKDEFSYTNITKTFSQSGFQAAICHYFDNAGPAMQSLPSFLASTNYQDPTDCTKTAFQKAFNTDLPAFEWAKTQPERIRVFQEFLATNRAGMPTFLDAYPVEERATATELSPERVLFVDVGGGLGQQAIAFRQRYPALPGRVILQDLAPILQHAIQHPSVEKMDVDFFAGQPVKGAKFYYLRNIFHDWPDEKARIIIQNTISAMATDSLLLIDDMVLPNVGVHWQAAQLDMQMMTTLAARERTQEQWYALLEGAGLKINRIYTYTASLKDSIIEAVPASVHG